MILEQIYWALIVKDNCEIDCINFEKDEIYYYDKNKENVEMFLESRKKNDDKIKIMEIAVVSAE